MTGIALALLRVVESHDPWFFTGVIVGFVILTGLLPRARSARVALRTLRRRSTS